MSRHRAYVGLGSNLGDRIATYERATEALRDLGTIAGRSALYRTMPWGSRNQPWFVNGVVALETELSARALLDGLLAIETRLGRTRTSGERWGPRTIDLDLLLYDDLEIDEAGLRVPHPHLRERAFVLVPLAELDQRFAALRDSLEESELAGVRPLEIAGPERVLGESVPTMPPQRLLSISERIRAIARFLASDDAVRVRITEGEDEIEILRAPRHVAATPRSSEQAPVDGARLRIDTIKADLVGIFHSGRPAPAEGDAFESDRELGFIEALGIRTPVHSMGAGRILSVATADGAPVEYGQPLFLVARG